MPFGCKADGAPRMACAIVIVSRQSYRLPPVMHTLMKGDEVVELLEEGADFALLSVVW